jgi:hypothetical protein
MKPTTILAFAASSWAAVNIGYTTNDKRQNVDSFVAWIDGGNPCTQSAFIDEGDGTYCGKNKAFTLINHHTYYVLCKSTPGYFELKNGDGSHNSWVKDGAQNPQQNWCLDGDRVYYVMRFLHFP